MREVSNMTQQIGVVGLAVMGKNLAWNIESRGYSVSVYNRSSEKQMKWLMNLKVNKSTQHILWKNLLIH